MISLLSALEEERQKLNEIGRESLEQGAPLFQNSALQAQSKKVDLLIVQLYRRVGIKQQSS
ncbi:aspartyl-phosphate phosphatase Spo0E family protein [Paenibacillus oralis]|uniref:Aspartyl-phosphate phosphatase Spo0E family protein n=2 Tax=Paenibacillus TaxID=44249 RepID=A0A3P3UD82_9BACL|nr:aspartyl-phosphate phosphatase Spo0E family protein [Paenibacillus oralis]